MSTASEKGDSIMVRAHWNGAVIAESDDTVIIDGNHYFPADAVNQDYLVSSDTTTVCPWKGRASYYSLSVEGEVNRDAAWFYPAPSAAARDIAGRVAFWHGVKIEDAGSSARRRSFFDRFRREAPDPAAVPTSVSPGDSSGRTRDVPVTDANDASFFAMLDGQITIVDFWAPWCGPCKSLHPLFDQQAVEHANPGLQFVRVNADDSPGVAAAFNIMSIPTIIVFDTDGHEIDREIGVPSRRRLDQLVRSAGLLAAPRNGRDVA